MSSDPASEGTDDTRPGVERLLALSDGVVAIAITLLVLELKVPSTELVRNSDSAAVLATQLGKGGDQWAAYLISFYVIAQFWLAHYRTFRQITGAREGLAWWNFAFLFTISVMPFTSDLLGNYSGNPLAVDIFAVNLLVASLATQATLLFGRRRGLVTTRAGSRDARAAWIRGVLNAAVIILSIGLAWVNTAVAKFSWLLLAAVPPAAQAIVRRLDRGERTRPGAPPGELP